VYQLKFVLRTIPVFLLIVWKSQLIQGQNPVITSIEIIGNEKTKNWVIEQRLPKSLDEEFKIEDRQKLIETARVNLVNTNLFNDVHADLFRRGNSQKVDSFQWKIVVVEKWYIWPIPFVEIADRNINQWHQLDFDPERVNYGLYLFNYNLLGANQTLKISLINGYTKNLGIDYMSGRLGSRFKYQIGGGYKFQEYYEVASKTESNKIVFARNPEGKLLTKQHGRLTFKEIFTNRSSHELSASWTNWEVIEMWQNFLDTDYFGTRSGWGGESGLSLWSLKSTWNLDHRDNQFFALDGIRLRLSLSLNNLESKKHEVFAETTLNADVFQPLPARTFGYLGLKARKRGNSNMPYLLANSLGFGDYVRGYENYVIDSRDFVMLKAGYRIALLQRGINLPWIPIRHYRTMNTGIYLGLFSDIAWTANGESEINQKWENDLADQWLLGYGVGLEGVFYYDKVFRFEYSLSRHGDKVFSVYFKQAISN